ncbi:MAG: orotidine-5'-phosphate decarboxylase [Chloroflexia bacterium]|nr:orotidine-5'-phosphate decarboxylase [Chloroflexia bacterium]
MTTDIADRSAAPAATSFGVKLAEAARAQRSALCVGLDPLPERLPAGVGTGGAGAARFCTAIIDATRDLACAYKVNLGFFLAFGREGIDALDRVRAAIPASIPIILDCKVGDIDNTAAAYARGWFDAFGFDALTVNPYLGEDSVAPFLSYADKGVFILCKTSNAGSGDVQDLDIRSASGETEPLFLTIARRVAAWAERYPATIGLVVGATYPAQLAAVRDICPGHPILLPGIGAQDGDLGAAVRAGVDTNGENLLVSASRSIIYASGEADFAEAARLAAIEIRDAINRSRLAIDRMIVTPTGGPDGA